MKRRAPLLPPPPSAARPMGDSSRAAAAAPPSPPVVHAPVPASVAMVPACSPCDRSMQRTRHAPKSATHTNVVFTSATPRPAASVAATLGPPSPPYTPALTFVRDATLPALTFTKRRRFPLAPSVKKRFSSASTASPYAACTFCAVRGGPPSALEPVERPEPRTVLTTPLARFTARMRLVPLSPKYSARVPAARDRGVFASAAHATPPSPAKATVPVPSSVHAVPGAAALHSG